MQTDTLAGEDSRWTAVLGRDEASDGRFVYAVASTGIYCRPSCPSRRPRRNQVRFFSSPAAAETEGFRACRRCEPRKSEPDARRRVREAREYLDRHLDETVTLERLGAAVGLSPYHLQRSFRRQTGMSPKAYADARRMERMKSGLRKGDTVSRATYDAGYTSTSRAYDHARARIGMTPAAYRRGGAGLRIRYTTLPTSLGVLLVAATDRGLCAVTLGDSVKALERRASERVSGCPDRSGRRSTQGLDHRRGGPAGGERHGPASAARPAGHSVSVEGLGGATANPDGDHPFVQRGRARDRASDGRPGGRRRVRREPSRGRDTMPSRGP